MAGMLAGWLQDERDKASGATASATKSEQLTHVGEKQKALSDRRWSGCEIELDRIELFYMAEGRVRGSQVGRRSRGTAFRHRGIVCCLYSQSDFGLFTQPTNPHSIDIEELMGSGIVLARAPTLASRIATVPMPREAARP